MTVPPPWAFTLATLAAWRIWKLLADDDILNTPRDWLEDRSRFWEKLLACPYCSGFWVALISTTAYALVADLDVLGFLVTAFALSASIVLVETAHDHLVLKKP